MTMFGKYEFLIDSCCSQVHHLRHLILDLPSREEEGLVGLWDHFDIGGDVYGVTWVGSCVSRSVGRCGE